MPSARPRVLLADDHPGVVKALDRVLSLECDVVEVVADGREVADAGARLQPVVVVVDVNLPNVRGLEICRTITAADPRAKVIVISAMLDEAMEEEAGAAGAFGVFSKFTGADVIVAAIKRAWSDAED